MIAYAKPIYTTVLNNLQNKNIYVQNSNTKVCLKKEKFFPAYHTASSINMLLYLRSYKKCKG